MKRPLGGGIWRVGTWALLCLGLGCVSTTLQVPSDHPARPGAPSGQTEENPGAVLDTEAPRYPSEGRSAGGPPGRAAASRSHPPSPDGTRQAPYVGEGVVERVGEGELEIRHGPIPGFMAAMTMSFATSPEVSEAGVEAGDAVRFKIESHPDHGYRIFSVELISLEAGGTSNQDDANENPRSHAPQP